MIVGVIWIMLKYRKLEKDAQKPIKDFKRKHKNSITLDGDNPDLKEQIKTLKSIYDKVEITIDANIPDLEKRVKFLKSIHDNVHITYSKD